MINTSANYKIHLLIVAMLIALGLHCSTTFAQSGLLVDKNPVVRNNNGWFMYFGNHRLNDKWGLHTEYQWRRHEIYEHWQQSLLRFGLDYHVHPNLMVTAGYGWIRSFAYGAQPIARPFNEHRIWQQLIHKQRTGRLYLNHRFRLEQRLLENFSFNSEKELRVDGYNYRNRARYRFMVSIPISKPELKDNTLFLALYDEVFLGFGNGIALNVLDQNRLFAALGWRFNDRCNVQAGYLNHYVIKGDGIQRENNHTLQLSLTYNLDFRKSEVD